MLLHSLPGGGVRYVSCEETEMAEILIDMESAGQWFGGAHFMNQLWPLNKVSWELGPFYPFDHGPTGLNTLVAPQWMTSSGLLVMMDPDTPCLHVGMNGPSLSNGKKTYRKWGTGVQVSTFSTLRGKGETDRQTPSSPLLLTFSERH